jgi:hypothetical protein
VTELQLAEPELHPVTLQIEERETLGLRGSSPPGTPDRVAIGKPQCIALDRAAVDWRGRRFLKAHADASYYLLAFDCSFRHDRESPLETAWLQVDLGIPQSEDGGTATAWSLEPLLQYNPISVSRTVNLSAMLKFVGPGGLAEIGPSASREKVETYEQQAVFLEGLGEGTSSPAWAFTRTPLVEIRGPFHFRLVAEVTRAARAEGVVSCGATIKHSLLGGIFSYSANLDDVPSVRIVSIPS